MVESLGLLFLKSSTLIPQLLSAVMVGAGHELPYVSIGIECAVQCTTTSHDAPEYSGTGTTTSESQ